MAPKDNLSKYFPKRGRPAKEAESVITRSFLPRIRGRAYRLILTIDEYNKLVRLAELSGNPKNAVVRVIVAEHLAKEGARPKKEIEFIQAQAKAYEVSEQGYLGAIVKRYLSSK